MVQFFPVLLYDPFLSRNYFLSEDIGGNIDWTVVQHTSDRVSILETFGL